MFYLPAEYSNYKYLADYGSNYLVLSTSRGIYGSSGDIDSVPCVIQYLSPSITTIESTYSSYDTYSFTDVSDSISVSVFDRADFPNIFICSCFILFIFGFVLNQLSKLVYKGGVFGSN